MAIYNQSFQPYPMYPQSIQPTPAFPVPTNYNNQADTGIIWVQGESGAKAYPVQAGKSVVLFDSETEHFFIKSVDISGMPQPLRTFSYSESPENLLNRSELDTSIFITRKEFEREIGEIRENFKDSTLNAEHRKGDRNGQSLIQSTKQTSKQ